MRNRFAKQRRSFTILRDLALPVLLFVAVAILFLQGVGAVSRTTGEEQLKSTRDAIMRAAVHCYAVEGAYPPNLDYLEQRYGLRVDRTRYLVDYQCFASNLMPDITVLGLEPAK